MNLFAGIDDIGDRDGTGVGEAGDSGAGARRCACAKVERVTVAALTYNRPQGLKRLLDHLEKLDLGAAEAETAVDVVIVDNSVEGNAAEAVLKRAETYRFPLHYAHETERGIAQARNLALQEASRRGGHRLAFIDDDEYPEPLWLARMMRIADETRAEIVVGALVPDFEVPPPLWLVRGEFLAIDALDDGAPVPVGNTSNVLFDVAFANRNDVRFDPSFALTGGEDTLFFDEMVRAGAKMVFCRTGVVHETIAPVRNTLLWNARRWMRSGNTDGRIAMRRSPGAASRLLTAFCGGMARLLIGGGRAALTAPMAAFGRPEVPAGELRIACRGAGFVRAAFGSVIEEYRTHER
ncbi:MAG: glycosyltransferase [Pseudomonadota bacterium]